MTQTRAHGRTPPETDSGAHALSPLAELLAIMEESGIPGRLQIEPLVDAVDRRDPARGGRR